ncbi:MAG: RluA family pseudouridine synthase [Microbacteriaceae bacterium]|nr:RluA family pseudouridine synthase [Microbacteriaceae bacterium]
MVSETETASFEIPRELSGERADVAISRIFGFSRNFAAEIIENGGLVFEGQRVRKSDSMITGAKLELTWTPKRDLIVEPLHVEGLAIVFEDQDLVVVDKPAGVASHPSTGWEGPTVLGGLASAGVAVSGLGPVERAGIVHRLDVGTSGLMVVAKSDLAYVELKKAFKNREVSKIYDAVVQGHPDPLAGTIDAPIGRHPSSRWKFAITSDGKPSVTHYATLEAFRSATLVEVQLETGRTHQIRVHMAAGHHPCVGDETYGASISLSKELNLSRQWLHAVRLGFRHPRDAEELAFESEYPTDLENAIEILRRQ